MSAETDSKAKATFWGPNTLNNPTPEETELLKNVPDFIKECQGQLEVGESGTPHYQFYVITKTQQRLSMLKKWLPRASFRIARNPAAVKNYCNKTETAVEGTQFVATDTSPHLSFRHCLEALYKVYYEEKHYHEKIASYCEEYNITEKKAKVYFYWQAVNWLLTYHPCYKNVAHMFARADMKEVWFNTSRVWFEGK